MADDTFHSSAGITNDGGPSEWYDGNIVIAAFDLLRSGQLSADAMADIVLGFRNSGHVSDEEKDRVISWIRQHGQMTAQDYFLFSTVFPTSPRSLSEDRQILIRVFRNMAWRYLVAVLARQVMHDPGPQDHLTLKLGYNATTTQELGTTLVALTRLHTKLWLSSTGRFADAIAYSTTHDERLEAEANLVITGITMNSPVTFTVALGDSLGRALAGVIDAVGHARLRWRKADIEVRKAAIEARTLAHEQAMREQRATLEMQAAQLELEREQLRLRRELVEVHEEILAREKHMIEIATDALRLQVDNLHPDLDAKAKAMLVQSMLPDALQLSNYPMQVMSPGGAPGSSPNQLQLPLE